MKDINSLSFQELAKMTDAQAREAFEAIRWPEGPVCPRCSSKNNKPVGGGRAGLYRCLDCRNDKQRSADQFTVTVGTIFEDSHIPLGKWLMAFHLICASEKGISALQLQRQLELGSYRSAWHMAHRIRHAMKSDPNGPMLRGVVEVDETYVGGKPRRKGQSKPGRGTRKAPVVAIIERGGKVTALSIQKIGGRNLKTAIRENVARSARIQTDEYAAYTGIGDHFDGGHQTVNHGRKQYVRGDVHVNSCESFFALLKRGVHGTFHHVERQHLGRYCDEFEFRWDYRKTTDGERTVHALRRSKGRRLMYRDPAGKIAV